MKRRLHCNAYAVTCAALAVGACCASPSSAFQHHASFRVSKVAHVPGRRREAQQNKHANANAHAHVNAHVNAHNNGRRIPLPLFLSDRTQALDLAQDELQLQQQQQQQGGTTVVVGPAEEEEAEAEAEGADAEYRRGLLTIGFITLLFSSMSPALHAALADTANGHAPPVLLLNAAVSVVALCGLVLGGPWLEAATPLPRSLVENRSNDSSSSGSSGESERESESRSTRMAIALPLEAQAGLELGFWKMLGTTANLYGLSLTTADHGAFLIQLTTLIVPVVQGVMGVPIPDRIKTAIALALGGVFLFTTDPSGGSCSAGADANAAAASGNLALGDALCVVAAGFYATYDLRLFKWGKLVAARELITGKILTQAILSVLLVVALGYAEAADYIAGATWENSGTIVLLALWAGLAVNAVAPFLQVGGQQAVGPTRAQTLYASQPLWASILSFAFLGETVGRQGLVGGAAFLSALFLAATAEPPDPECGVQNCEV